MYEFDSFFSLTPWERVGLGALSVLFALICVALVWTLCRVRAWPLCVLIAVVVLWGFVWISPQGYYAYYRLIFEGLPPRWVIPQMPSVADMWGHLTFTGRATLSSHTKGALGWVLVVVALVSGRKCRDAAN